MRRTSHFAFAMLMLAVAGNAAADDAPLRTPHLHGHYSDTQLGSINSFTLPRTYLYDASGQLVQLKDWPAELGEVTRALGQAYCCVEDAKGRCLPIPYGAMIDANFAGLLDDEQKPLMLASLPQHQWLLVDFSASWCAPCKEETKALQQYFAKSNSADQYVWLTIDMSRLIEAQDAAKKNR